MENCSAARIGILGGTFNPIHNSHIAMAKAAIRCAKLDCVLLTVAKCPPHKSSDDIIKAEYRLEMARMAAENEPQISVSTIEFELGGVSYTALTLEAIQKLYPKARLFYIVGSDTLESMPYWYKSADIFSSADIVCIHRKGTPSCADMAEYIKSRFKASITMADCEAGDISSTRIRENIRSHISIGGLVPENVEKYIYKNGLYK